MNKTKKMMQIIIPLLLVVSAITILSDSKYYENSFDPGGIILLLLFTISGSIVFLLFKFTSIEKLLDPIGYVHIKILETTTINSMSQINDLLNIDEKWSLLTSYIMPICEGLEHVRHMIANDQKYSYLELEIIKSDNNRINRIYFLINQELGTTNDNVEDTPEISILKQRLQNIVNKNYD